ncbi:potassium channel subfamily K member 16-like isoform X3 [Podarcis raffonei]|uniref:potassium channel subfamily K member 16-like isoform X3 n=1 Tax=Podarcis raffonei TaxID=65483 RepID=UPI0023296878|nr:potassium channel subfamily K member 16-like isoform X3 [Podarcis raffonei]
MNNMRVSRVQGLLLVAGILTYLLMGALIFELLEKDHYLKMEDAMFHMKEEFFSNYTALSPEEVELVIQKLVKYVQMGVEPIGRHDDEGRASWDFSTSFFFVGTMLSTIGIKQDRTYFPGYRVLGAAWIVVGLAWIAVLFQRVSSFLAPEDPKPSSPKKSKR